MKSGESFIKDLEAAQLGGVNLCLGDVPVTAHCLTALKQDLNVPGDSDGSAKQQDGSKFDKAVASAMKIYQRLPSPEILFESLAVRSRVGLELHRAFRGTKLYLLALLLVAVSGFLFVQLWLYPLLIEVNQRSFPHPINIQPENSLSWVPVLSASFAVVFGLLFGLVLSTSTGSLATLFGGRVVRSMELAGVSCRLVEGLTVSGLAVPAAIS